LARAIDNNKMFVIPKPMAPERVGIVLSELCDAGFPAVTKIDVVGRGKQRGVKVGDVHYDEIPKEMLMLVVKDEDSVYHKFWKL